MAHAINGNSVFQFEIATCIKRGRRKEDLSGAE